jgi:hypothetical protein
MYYISPIACASCLSPVYFEPIEPAFCLKVSRLASYKFEILCIVDISYVRNEPAMETGIGVSIVVQNIESLAI